MGRTVVAAGMMVTLVVLLVAGCSRDRRAGKETTPGRGDGRASVAVDGAVNPMRTLPERLDELVGRAQEEFHEAHGDDAVRAIEERYARLVADDAGITDAAIAREISSREDNLADLHSGEERVYPDEGTMNAMMGVPAMLRRALELRGRPAPPR